MHPPARNDVLCAYDFPEHLDHGHDMNRIATSAPMAGMLLMIVSACDNGTDKPTDADIYAKTASAAEATALGGVEHWSSTALSISSSTRCVLPAASETEDELRANYTPDAGGLCREVDAGNACIYALADAESTLIYRSNPNVIDIEASFLGQLHTWTFFIDPSGPRDFYAFGTTDVGTCDVDSVYDTTYTAQDLAGTFDATVYFFGPQPPDPQIVSSDTLVCAEQTCSGQSGSVSLQLPIDSFENTRFQGFVEAASATIDGTEYAAVSASVSPSKDRATVIACPDGTNLSDYPSACLMIALERRL